MIMNDQISCVSRNQRITIDPHSGVASVTTEYYLYVEIEPILDLTYEGGGG